MIFNIRKYFDKEKSQRDKWLFTLFFYVNIFCMTDKI